MFILGFVPDAILALVGSFWVDQGVLVAAAIFVGLGLLRLVRWAVVGGFDWIYFHLLGRKQMASFLCDYLHENKFPEPQNFELSGEDYLEGVVNNGEVDVETRLKAASDHGTIIGHRVSGQWGMLMQSSLALEDAIVEYKRTFTRASVAGT